MNYNFNNKEMSLSIDDAEKLEKWLKNSKRADEFLTDECFEGEGHLLLCKNLIDDQECGSEQFELVTTATYIGRPEREADGTVSFIAFEKIDEEAHTVRCGYCGESYDYSAVFSDWYFTD